jgi:hypothetical protein
MPEMGMGEKYAGEWRPERIKLKANIGCGINQPTLVGRVINNAKGYRVLTQSRVTLRIRYLVGNGWKYR